MCFSRSSACHLCRRLILTRQAVAQAVALAVPNEEALPILDDAAFSQAVQAVLVKRLPAGQEGEGDADRSGAGCAAVDEMSDGVKGASNNL